MTVLDELDWRREVTRLYAAVREERSPSVAHGGWVTARDLLLAEHPCSPADRGTFPGLEVPDHDEAWRVEVPLLPAPDRRLSGPVLDAWAQSGEPEPYAAGSDGPAASAELMRRDGRQWHRIGPDA